jgi:hypothetical protein
MCGGDGAVRLLLGDILVRMQPTDNIRCVSTIHWAAIAGKWSFNGEPVRYEGPLEGAVYPYGLALSSQHLRDGKAHVRIALPDNTGAVGAVVIGYRSQRDPHVLAQLGAWDAAYAFAAWVPGVGWQRLDFAGSAKNLQPGRDYELMIELLGQRLRMTVDAVEVLQTIVETPLAGTVIGLHAGGTGPVTFSGFRLSDTQEPAAFVMMPFKEPFDTLYREVIHPVTAASGFRVIRIDEIMAPGIIIDDIQRQIAEAHVVIAEITQPNPNVFYELGYAHALRKPAILLARRDPSNQLPFDVRSYRAIFYDDTIGGKDSVERALKQHLEALRHRW